jgi:hypothetical protein
VSAELQLNVTKSGPDAGRDALDALALGDPCPHADCTAKIGCKQAADGKVTVVCVEGHRTTKGHDTIREQGPPPAPVKRKHLRRVFILDGRGGHDGSLSGGSYGPAGRLRVKPGTIVRTTDESVSDYRFTNRLNWHAHDVRAIVICRPDEGDVACYKPTYSHNPFLTEDHRPAPWRMWPSGEIVSSPPDDWDVIR